MAAKSKKKLSSRKKHTNKKIQKGTVGNFFIFGILALLIFLGMIAVGGLPSQTTPESGNEVRIITPTPGKIYNNLQLKWFGYVTIAPTPTPVTSSLCNNKSVNTEPNVLAAFSPTPGNTVSSTGQIKVWVNDEGSPLISQGEQVNLTSGQVTARGNVAGKAPDGYLWEPALYISPSTAESGGTPHFPDSIKGDFNNNPPVTGSGIRGAPIDPAPQGTTLSELFTAEDIWNIADLGLTTGTYQVEIVVHDGDIDRAVGCFSITIQ